MSLKWKIIFDVAFFRYYGTKAYIFICDNNLRQGCRLPPSTPPLFCFFSPLKKTDSDSFGSDSFDLMSVKCFEWVNFFFRICRRRNFNNYFRARKCVRKENYRQYRIWKTVIILCWETVRCHCLGNCLLRTANVHQNKKKTKKT